MIISIQSPKNPDYPPSANQLYVSDTWTNKLNEFPVFSCELRKVNPDTKEPTPILGLPNVTMTKQQWYDWSVKVDDETYILSCVLENLGLESA